VSTRGAPLSPSSDLAHGHAAPDPKLPKKITDGHINSATSLFSLRRNGRLPDVTSPYICCSSVVAIKVIRNKQTGQSEGYGFVEFYSHSAAEKVLDGFAGHNAKY
jgi:RNA recognition motif-containing protein